MKLYSIASGSSGNCIYISSDTTKLLVDTGISKKRIEEGLREIDVEPAYLNGILITHEHSDHIKGLGVMSRKYHIPIYATGKTIDAIREMHSLGEIDDDLYCPIKKDHEFRLGDIQVHPIEISHDAAEPVAYRFWAEGKSVGVITDLGVYDGYTVDCLQKQDAMLIEANHDVHMLQVGAYPYYLKQRILGSQGHLSNDASADLLCHIMHDGLKQVLLGHLSLENNFEDLALETVRQEAQITMNQKGIHCPDIQVAHRDRPSEVIEV